MEHHQILAKPGAELRKGPWLKEEDEALIAAVSALGERRWDALAKASGLRRSGKSCRLRWMNYLRPNLKHGHITPQEEKSIIKLHKKWGNRWARIARRVPGRTDNEIKNYWRSHLRKEALHLQQEQTLSTNTTKQHWEQNTMVGIVDVDASASSSSETGGRRIFNNLRSCAEHNSGTMDEPWSVGLAYSPYETGLLDWISPTCSKMETTWDDCSSNPGSGWVSGGGNCSELSCFWDGSAVSIWDMD